RTPLPAALVCRGTTRLFCRPRPQRTGARLCPLRGGPGSAAKLLGKDEARRIAANIATLPDPRRSDRPNPVVRAARYPPDLSIAGIAGRASPPQLPYSLRDWSYLAIRASTIGRARSPLTVASACGAAAGNGGDLSAGSLYRA